MGGKSKPKGPSRAEILAQQRAEAARKQTEQLNANREAEVQRREQRRGTMARRRGMGRSSLISMSERGVSRSNTLG